MAYDKEKILPLLRHAFGLDATMKEIAAYAGVSLQTLYTWLNDNPDLRNELEALREQPLLKARQTVLDNIDDPNHARWYLERKKKDEFAQRSEHIGKWDDDQLETISDKIKALAEPNDRAGQQDTRVSQDSLQE